MAAQYYFTTEYKKAAIISGLTHFSFIKPATLF